MVSQIPSTDRKTLERIDRRVDRLIILGSLYKVSRFEEKALLFEIKALTKNALERKNFGKGEDDVD